MGRLLAEDLQLLCWDDDEGTAAGVCQGRLAAALAGALVLDAAADGAVELAEGVARTTGRDAGDLLLDRVVEAVGSGERPLEEVVRSLTSGTESAVRERLLDEGLLRVERRRVLLVVARDRLALSDPEDVRTLADEIWPLLHAGPGDDAPLRTAALAALVAASGLVEALDQEAQERAEQHAAELAAAAGTTPVVEAVAEAQLHDWARARGGDLAASHRLGLAAGGLDGGVGFDPG